MHVTVKQNISAGFSCVIFHYGGKRIIASKSLKNKKEI